ncbi:hypothetical protein [Cupriavidus sp. UYPR2.512]|uniref:hypothetical protein n=1 Tax=Cupriavidus sp. UYPR2.512 TaxID=1080187 RepID=UPI0003795360|nr:hypothetical protein [Cupriavidus sp. UYPR2.512]UIF89456.1 hypothetical protein KAF44_29755 [Cupriavidus necator]
MNCNKANTSQWMSCRVVFSATRDGRRVDNIEITGCLAVFDRSKDLGEQAGSAVADWLSRQERVHGYRYQDAQITYLEVTTSDGRFLDATKLGWAVLKERQVAPPPARERSELESGLVQAIEASGFSVSGPTDSRAAEHGEPAWVCNARGALALSAAGRLLCSGGNIKDQSVPVCAKYVVVDEHTLGYRIEETPRFIGVLAGSVLRGGHNPIDGPAVIIPGLTRLRAATEIDFEFFRVVLPPDFVWADGGCERDRWDAGQHVLDCYVWPADLAIIGRRGWTLKTRQHLHCFVDASYPNAQEISRHSGRVKLDFHVEFDKGGIVTKAYAVDKDGEAVGYRGDVAASTGIATAP